MFRSAASVKNLFRRSRASRGSSETERTSEPHHRMRRKLQRVHYAPKRALSRGSLVPCQSSSLQHCSSPTNSSSNGATRGSFRACACKFQTAAVHDEVFDDARPLASLPPSQKPGIDICRWDKDAPTLHYTAVRCEPHGASQPRSLARPSSFACPGPRARQSWPTPVPMCTSPRCLAGVFPWGWLVSISRRGRAP